MTTQTAHAQAYMDNHLRALREHAANLVRRGPRPGHALVRGFVDDARWFPREVRMASVRAHVRSARKFHTVLEYDTTDRAGTGVRVVHIRHAPGTWSNATEVVDIYEIPIATLTAL